MDLVAACLDLLALDLLAPQLRRELVHDAVHDLVGQARAALGAPGGSTRRSPRWRSPSRGSRRRRPGASRAPSDGPRTRTARSRGSRVRVAGSPGRPEARRRPASSRRRGRRRGVRGRPGRSPRRRRPPPRRTRRGPRGRAARREHRAGRAHRRQPAPGSGVWGRLHAGGEDGLSPRRNHANQPRCPRAITHPAAAGLPRPTGCGYGPAVGGPAHRRDGRLRRLRGPDRRLPPRASCDGGAAADLPAADRLGRSRGRDRTAFFRAFPASAFEPTVLELFDRTCGHPEGFLVGQDLVLVGGGNTVNMLAIWRAARRRRGAAAAWEAGVVLAGLERRRRLLVRGVHDRLVAARRRGPAARTCSGSLPGRSVRTTTSSRSGGPATKSSSPPAACPAGSRATTPRRVHLVGTELAEAVAWRAGARAWRVDAGRATACDGRPPDARSSPSGSLRRDAGPDRRAAVARGRRRRRRRRSRWRSRSRLEPGCAAARDVIERAIAEGRDDVRRHDRVRGAGRHADRALAGRGVAARHRDLARHRGRAVRSRARRRARCSCCGRTCWPLGHSGVRPEVVDLMVEMLNRDVIPSVPEQGSLGASGDLAPLACLALPLIGAGHVLTADGGREPASSRVRACRARDARAGGEGGPRARQRHAGHARGRRPRARARRTADAHGRRRGGDDDRGRARHGRAVRRTPPAAPTASGPGRERREPAPAAGQLADRASRTAIRRIRCRTRTRCGARRRCTAPRATRARTSGTCWRSR